MDDPRLPDAEMEVLACLHRRGEVTARAIREDLLKQRPMAHGSVLTLLSRLQRRGLVTRRPGPVGKAFLYAPAQRPSITTRPLLKRLVDRVFSGNSADLVASLFETRTPTAKELDDIQRLIANLKKTKRAHR